MPEVHCYSCGAEITASRALTAGGSGRCPRCDSQAPQPAVPTVSQLSGPLVGPPVGPPAPSAMTTSAPRAPLIAGGSLSTAAMFGLAAAIATALVWYLIVVTIKIQSVWLSIGIGFAIGRAIVLGAGRRRGVEVQVMAVAFTLAALLVSEYFIGRFFLIDALKHASGSFAKVPLFMSFGDAKSVVSESLKADPATYLFWGISLVAAFVTSGEGGRWGRR